MASVTLNNGVEMPLLGYGTYQTPPRLTEGCVRAALEAGYRSIDTAQCYGNEEEVGQACRNSGLPRRELFITTKLWGCYAYRDTLRSIDASLHSLGLDYIDLLLLHEPSGRVYEIYRAMEDAYREGKLRAIGVSNFLEERYTALLEHCQVVPAVNQVETHVFRQQKKLRLLEQQQGTRHESWSPLACGRNGIFTHPVLTAIARQHGKTVAQVALRFLLQQDIIVIPKTTHRERMEENLAAASFTLTAADMAALEQLEEGRSLFGWW